VCWPWMGTGSGDAAPFLGHRYDMVLPVVTPVQENKGSSQAWEEAWGRNSQKTQGNWKTKGFQKQEVWPVWNVAGTRQTGLHSSGMSQDEDPRSQGQCSLCM
jgi:hypothetical protein